MLYLQLGAHEEYRDGANWVKTKSLQKKGDKAAKAFLKGEGEEDLRKLVTPYKGLALS